MAYSDVLAAVQTQYNSDYADGDEFEVVYQISFWGVGDDAEEFAGYQVEAYFEQMNTGAMESASETYLADNGGDNTLNTLLENDLGPDWSAAQPVISTFEADPNAILSWDTLTDSAACADAYLAGLLSDFGFKIDVGTNPDMVMAAKFGKDVGTVINVMMVADGASEAIAAVGKLAEGGLNLIQGAWTVTSDAWKSLFGGVTEEGTTITATASYAGDTFEAFASARGLTGVEASKAWEVFQRAKASQGLIIGPQAVVADAVANGYDKLIMLDSSYSWAVNQAWLDGAVATNKPVVIVGDLSRIGSDLSSGKPGALYTEIRYLIGKGYSLEGGTLVPP